MAKAGRRAPTTPLDDEGVEDVAASLKGLDDDTVLIVIGVSEREREPLIEPTPRVVRTPNASPPCLLGLAIGCCFTLPPENPDTNGVRFRSEQRPASLRAVTCLGLFDGLSVRPLQATSFHHHTAVPRPKRAAGVQCRHCHRPAGNFVAATDGVNESRTPSGTAPGARAEPVKPCPAFTLSGGPAPSRVGEFARKLRMHSQAFPAPPRQFCL